MGAAEPPEAEAPAEVAPEPAQPAPQPPPAAAPTPAPAPSPAAHFLERLRRQDGESLKRADFEEAAHRLGCEWEFIAAVAIKESRRLGFADDGRPIIRFEPHLFNRITDNRFVPEHGEMIRRAFSRQADRWTHFAQVYALDPEAALRSASFGMFQVLGDNYPQMGMANAHDYVAALARSEKDQLAAFEAYVRRRNLLDEMRDKNWAGFARVYNGPAYQQNQYDTLLERHFNELKASPIA